MTTDKKFKPQKRFKLPRGSIQLRGLEKRYDTACKNRKLCLEMINAFLSLESDYTSLETSMEPVEISMNGRYLLLIKHFSNILTCMVCITPTKVDKYMGVNNVKDLNKIPSFREAKRVVNKSKK